MRYVSLTSDALSRSLSQLPFDMNAILRRLSVIYGSVYQMPLHLKTGDGDLPLIKEPALLTRCACISHEIYRPALLARVSWINPLPCCSNSVCTPLGLLLVYLDYLSALACWILFTDRRPTLALGIRFVLPHSCLFAVY